MRRESGTVGREGSTRKETAEEGGRGEVGSGEGGGQGQEGPQANGGPRGEGKWAEVSAELAAWQRGDGTERTGQGKNTPCTLRLWSTPRFFCLCPCGEGRKERGEPAEGRLRLAVILPANTAVLDLELSTSTRAGMLDRGNNRL